MQIVHDQIPEKGYNQKIQSWNSEAHMMQFVLE